ncbi:MAG: type I methionyl aminopeptidase [Candidatus Pacebacteria bacterium]|nr:type I methionyl aminopeptidase [Candidatus Paceibacterota bacterium]
MIPIKTQKEIEIMIKGGKILAGIMKKLKTYVRPGISTQELNKLAKSLILNSGGKCSFEGYNKFPACLCTSVNEEIVHGVPSNRILKNGDIISLDLGLLYNGFHTDMAITVAIGEVDPETKRLIRITKKVLKLAIKKARPGICFGDISNTIQRYAESQGFTIIRDLRGHGIGKQLHQEPEIQNYGKRHKGLKLEPGMVFCLEPMLSIGDYRIKKGKDGFAFQTKDDSLSAHFEHTIAVTENGNIVLTNLE